MVVALVLLLAAEAGFEESFRAGLLALQRNDWKQAETQLTAASKLAPSNGRVWIALAQTYRKLGDTAKADAAAEKASGLGQKDALVAKSLAIYYSEAGQILKAARAQARYSALAPQDVAALEKTEALYFEAVQPLLQQRKFAQAISILNEARERIQHRPQLELALGVAFYGLRQFDNAATAFLATIAIAPDLEQPYRFLGQSLDQIPGRVPEVMGRFVSYEKAHPAAALGYLLHAKALSALSGEPAQVRALLEKAISLNEADASAHFELGALYYRKQLYAESAREFERSAALEPENAATHYRLANVYSRLGKHEAAQAERELHARLARDQ
jgi:tetratricopeptide (TPR) repeat protein